MLVSTHHSLIQLSYDRKLHDGACVALFTKDVFPHRRGEIITVLMMFLKF